MLIGADKPWSASAYDFRLKCHVVVAFQAKALTALRFARRQSIPAIQVSRVFSPVTGYSMAEALEFHQG